ncbi:MAG: CDP-alcohol phosphatidyltransferase [Candidatus Lokiarchaeota archaeon]|nr:CDP-alcohol phosphatidyltransferase [Candidatus Lokiarchaeota archaeon]MBD3340209.1 CDP-alcohol phosphatidyltransferase [Candidatus Lokiarchaeota archaeon]
MIDNWFSKSKLRNAIKKVAHKLFLGRISANQLTIVGLILGLICALTIFLSEILPWRAELIITASVLMALSFFVDMLDGAVARLEGPTTFGGILDMFSDRIVEISIILALVSTNISSLAFPGLLSFASITLCITIFLAIGAAVNDLQLKESEKVIYYSKGLMERSETFIFLLFLTIFWSVRFVLLWLFAILVFITAIQRFRVAYKLFYKKE